MNSVVTVLKEMVKGTPLWPPLRSILAGRRLGRAYEDWLANGKPIPPPHAVKQYTLRSLAKRFGIRVLVETGTCHGEMLQALKHDFRALYSIELSERFHAAAVERFRSDGNIHLRQGDSGRELGAIVAMLTEPALFWLDGHYSEGETARGDKDTPVIEELQHISRSPIEGHVIVIDDARCFGADPAYPTLDEARAVAGALFPSHSMEVEADGIRLLPAGARR